MSERKCEIVMGDLGTYVPGRIEYSQELINDMIEAQGAEPAVKELAHSAASWIAEGLRQEMMKRIEIREQYK